MNWYNTAMRNLDRDEETAYYDLSERIDDAKYRILNDYLTKHPDINGGPNHWG